MKLFVCILLSCGTIASNKSLELNPEFILNFLNFNNLRSGICYYCRPLPENWFEIFKTEFINLSYLKIPSAKKIEDNKTFAFNQPKVGVIFDTTCNETSDLFEQFSSLKVFNGSFSWLMFAESFEATLKMLSSQYINLDADITLAVAISDRSFELFDVYNPNSRTNGQLVVNPIGQWTQENGYNVTKIGTKFERRSNLNGAVYRAVVIAHPTNTTLIPYLEKNDKVVDAAHRFNYNLFKILQAKYNFR